MCGLIGIGATAAVTTDETWLVAGRDQMRHRGPDDSGEWWSHDHRVGLGHRRLSVIDLSPGGHQPMRDTDGRLTVVFNGEIYNYRDLRSELAAAGATFQSQSDTEVILAAYRQWGEDCLARLNGAFAFALHDNDRKIILLARDRAGEKPLFYTVQGKTLRFASELKALLADPSLERKVDPNALDWYLAMGYVPGDRCILKGFHKLPPAHALRFSLDTGVSHVWRYWSLPNSPRLDVPVDETTLLDELDRLLEDAVQRQLIADVPVGVLLSGGIDSSLIVAMATRTASRVRTFTVRFPGHGKLDETQHARLIARHFGTEHIELNAEPTPADILLRLARQFDEPMADSSMIPTALVSDLVKGYCTVALGGDGGDELFGGYSHYSRLLRVQQRFGWIPRGMRTSVSAAAERLLPIGVKGRDWLQGIRIDTESGLPAIATFFDPTTRRRLVPGIAGVAPVAVGGVNGRSDLLDHALRADFTNYLAEDILVKVDRASMLSSLEVRAPFLDYRVVEFAFGRVPSANKATPDESKLLLKKLTARLLPPEFDRHRKQGFSIPLAEWLKGGSFRELFHDVLLFDDARWFDRATVQSLLDGLDKGRAVADRLFNLVLLELWRREYRVTF